jgi:hypothetical protein
MTVSKPKKRVEYCADARRDRNMPSGEGLAERLDPSFRKPEVAGDSPIPANGRCDASEST